MVSLSRSLALFFREQSRRRSASSPFHQSPFNYSPCDGPGRSCAVFVVNYVSISSVSQSWSGECATESAATRGQNHRRRERGREKGCSFSSFCSLLNVICGRSSLVRSLARSPTHHRAHREGGLHDGGCDEEVEEVERDAAAGGGGVEFVEEEGKLSQSGLFFFSFPLLASSCSPDLTFHKRKSAHFQTFNLETFHLFDLFSSLYFPRPLPAKRNPAKLSRRSNTGFFCFYNSVF